MTGVYETEDGTQYNIDELQRKDKCDFCGKLGEISEEDGFSDGHLLGITGEGHLGNRADACRECVAEGLTKEAIDEAIGSKEEIKQEMGEKTVELS